jgi:hypothetical protein
MSELIEFLEGQIEINEMLAAKGGLKSAKPKYKAEAYRDVLREIRRLAIKAVAES